MRDKRWMNLIPMGLLTIIGKISEFEERSWIGNWQNKFI